MRVAVKSHALPIYKKNRIALLLCIFETTIQTLLLFCQPRAEVTSFLFTKLWDLPFMTGLIIIIDLSIRVSLSGSEEDY